MKSIHYVATITRAYRKAIDSFLKDPEKYTPDNSLFEEVKKAASRPFTTGFYFPETEEKQFYQKEHKFQSDYKFVGLVKGFEELHGESFLNIEQRNYFQVGDTLEIVSPDNEYLQFKISKIINSEGEEVTAAPHPQENVKVPFTRPISENALVRKIPQH